MSILFFGKKTKNECEKLLTIYLRVTINGERFEVSTQRYVGKPLTDPTIAIRIFFVTASWAFCGYSG